jgi:transcription initiation factor TFIIIB Brf1 subunit/transcription initiation factor TFIIB
MTSTPDARSAGVPECSHRGAQVYDEEAGEVYCGRCGEFLRVPGYDE